MYLFEHLVTKRKFVQGPTIRTFSKAYTAANNLYVELGRLFIKPTCLYQYFDVSEEDCSIN